MEPDTRLARFVAAWLAPCVVVVGAVALGLVLFASADPWWPPMAGPAPGVVASPDNASIGHR